MNIKVQQYIKEIDSAFSLAENQNDDEVKSYFAYLLCIRISGLIENYLKTKVSDYSDKKVPKQITRFLSIKFADITNLKTTKLLEILGQFSLQWKSDFEVIIQNNVQLKSSLDSLINNRHNIAHGQRASLTLRTVRQYYEDVQEIINELDKIIK